MSEISNSQSLISDENLIQLIRAGDEEALGTLVQRYEKLVAYLARSYTSAGLEQEDLIQDGMLGLARALNGYSPFRDASFNTYASVCIKNSLISAVRRSRSGDKRLNVLYIEDVGGLEDMPGSGQAPSEPEPYGGGYLEDITSLLSSFEREVLRLYMSGMSRKDMARASQKDEKSIDNALVRIKKKARSSRPRR